MNNEVTEKPDHKSFTFRCIPPELHKKWKIFSGLKDKSMEEVGLIAIDTYINNAFREQQKEEAASRG